MQDSWRVAPRLTVDGGVRVTWIGPADDLEGRGIVVWDQGRYSPDAPAGELSGMVWHAVDPSVPTSGVRMPVFATPRVGFAWDAAGTGATVVRGGFGVYRYADPPQYYGRMVDLAYGVRNYVFCCGTSLRRLEGLAEGAVSGARPSTRPTTSSRARCPGASLSIACCPGRRASKSDTSAAGATTS